MEKVTKPGKDKKTGEVKDMLVRGLMKCNHCQKEDTALTGKEKQEGVVIRETSTCTHSGKITVAVFRNRDLNAAMNIWNILICILNKQNRPKYLHRPGHTVSSFVD